MNNKEWKIHHKDALAKRFNELPESGPYDHLKDHADYKNYDKITRLDVRKKLLLKKYGKLNEVDKYEQYVKDHVNK